MYLDQNYFFWVHVPPQSEDSKILGGARDPHAPHGQPITFVQYVDVLVH